MSLLPELMMKFNCPFTKKFVTTKFAKFHINGAKKVYVSLYFVACNVKLFSRPAYKDVSKDYMSLFQVISLPSQACSYKVKITDTSFVAKAEIVEFKGL